MKKIILFAVANIFAFASGTYSFAELAAVRTIYGVFNHDFRQIYAGVSTFNPNAYGFEKGLMQCTSSDCAYNFYSGDEIKINSITQYHKGGVIGESSGVFGYTQNNAIKSSEDIYFELALLRDRSQFSGDLFVNLAKSMNAFNGVNTAEIGRYATGLTRLWDTYGLKADFCDTYDCDWAKLYRFSLKNDYNNFVSVQAYVEDYPNSLNFITNPKLKRNDFELNAKNHYGFMNYTSKYYYDNRTNLDFKRAPELVSTNYWYQDGVWKSYIQHSKASFMINTLKYCKQRVLYKIEVKRIQLPGENMDYTIFDTYPKTDKCSSLGTNNITKKSSSFNQSKMNENTWWGYFDGQSTCTGNTWWHNNGYDQGDYTNITRDWLHLPSTKFYFYVIQNAWSGDSKFEQDCLPTPNAKITSAFVDSTSGLEDNLSFNFKTPINATDIYTYLDKEDAYIKLDFNDKDNVFELLKDPFVENNTRYISIDVGNTNKDSFSYYLQKDCVDFNDKNCKYKHLTWQNNQNEMYYFNTGRQGILYKDMCNFANTKIKQHLGNNANVCNPNDPARQNEIFFKYSNALLHLKNLQTNASDKGRREFIIRFYPSINSIAGVGAKIKHSPITVRPKYFEAKQESCPVATNCTKVINASFDNGTIYDNKIFIDKYLLKVDYPNVKPYLFNLAKNYKIVDDNNPIVLENAKDNNDAFMPIIPFDSANIASIVLKDAHIKKYLQDYFKNPSYDYTRHCSDDSAILTMQQANKRDEKTGKIACLTPMKDFILVKPTGVESAILYKDSVDKDARVNVVLNNTNLDNKNFTFAYYIYPQLQAQASNLNKQNIAKYYTDDVNIEFTPSFNLDVNLANFVLEQDMKALNRAYADKIELKDGVFKITVSKEELNKYFKIKLDELNDNTKTTFNFLNQANNMTYENVSRFEAMLSKTKRVNSLMLANENANEIPLKFYYTNKAPIFTLNDVKIKVLKNSQLKNDILLNQNVGVKFVSASPFFKDIKVNNGKVLVTIDDKSSKIDIKPMLKYLDKDKQYKEFIYQDKTSKEDAWSADCINANKICYRKLPHSKLPGYDAKFSSDYGLSFTTGNDFLKIENIKQKNSAYIKDTVYCFNGEFNCDTSFTVEFKN